MDEFCLQSYDYHLPQDRIASHPVMPKENARLLVYHKSTQEIFHTHFSELFSFIPKDALWVFNDTRVLKARLFGHKLTGGEVEILFHQEIPDFKSQFLVQIKGRVREGDWIRLSDGFGARVCKLQEDGLRVVEFVYCPSKDFSQVLDLADVHAMLETLGHIPLPPYIKRADNQEDERDYQSVFARHYGAIAAPTASLHFSEAMMQRVCHECEHIFLTLHVGAGTFRNVESTDIRNHHIHSERLFASQECIDRLKASRRIFCIGTTAMRSVEFLARLGPSSAYAGECDIFLHPANKPIKTDFLLTNFHLPKSTLLMLVASMIGLQECHRIYAEAIALQYRFYSYGDGMLII